jgi:hypothetical protein
MMEMAGEREQQLISNSNRRESGPRMGYADPYCGIKLKPERRGMAPRKGLSLVVACVL